MLHDWVIRGACIGLMADVVKLLFNYIAFTLGYTQDIFWRVTATYFFAPEQLFTPAALLAGAMADIAVSAAFGVLFLYLTRNFIGEKYLWIKGIGYGMLIWVVVFGSLLGKTIAEKLPQSATGILVTTFAHALFGLCLGLFTELLAERADAKRR